MKNRRQRPFNRHQARHVRRSLVDLFNGVCVLCGRALGGSVTIEHLTPLSKGGRDAKENLAPAHGRCNERRSSRSLIEACAELEEENAA